MTLISTASSLAACASVLLVASCQPRTSAIAPSSVASPGTATVSAPSYPAAAKGDVVDDYHGTRVADPYRWLEDPASPATRSWVASEDQLTTSILSKLPGRAAILRRLTKLYNYEKFSAPFKEGSKYFWTHNDGLQNQDVLLWDTKADGPGKVLLDPNSLSKDGTVSLSAMTVSRDGKYLAYAISRDGSDWQEWYVRDVDTGEDLPDHLRWSQYSDGAFGPDNRGFYYSRFPAPPSGKVTEEATANHALYYHRLGQDQSRDERVYARPDEPAMHVYGGVTEDGRFLVISLVRAQNKNGLYVRDLAKKGAPIIPLVTTTDARYSVVAGEGSSLIVLTNKDAPHGKLMRVDLRRANAPTWQPFLDETSDQLDDVTRVGNRFFFTYVHDAHTRIAVRDGFDPGAPIRDIALPGIGTASGFAGHATDEQTFWSYTSFTEPGVIYRYDVASATSSEIRRVKADFDGERYETRQVFFSSKDGTKVPMFVLHRKGLVLDGSNPTVIYGYGGFGSSLTPAYRSSLSVWMDLGGVYASVNARGGGEYGEEWHRGGSKENKQHSFDDFIAAAEWLMANHYTSPRHLGINGGSNGGLMVGAVETQRPELFGACVADVGVLDMLRYHRFTSGHMWAQEYGTADDPQQFRALFQYSPLHHVRPGTAYPATLLTTSDHDDRVVPAHSYKFAAAMQAAQAGPAPILIRIEKEAGHGGGLPTAKLLDASADRWTFFANELGVDRARLTAE